MSLDVFILDRDGAEFAYIVNRIEDCCGRLCAGPEYQSSLGVKIAFSLFAMPTYATDYLVRVEKKG